MYAYRPATGPSNGKGVQCIWVPLHKKDNHSDIKNYRPITILAAAVDKVFEQLLSNQVTQFMEPYLKLLSNCLTAYRKQNSWTIGKKHWIVVMS